MNTKYPGKLISLEGIDGSGKSTLVKALSDKIRQLGHSVVLTKEHGGTPLGLQLRSLLHLRTNPMCDKSEFLIIAADRAQHFQQVVIPALAGGNLVISDRMNDSSMAYQGYGRGLDLAMIRTVNSWVMDNIKQDLIFFLDIDPQVALKRVLKRNEQLTAFEQEKLDFWQRVRAGYQEIFKGRLEVVTLDGTQSQEVLLAQALKIIKERGLV